MPLSEHEQKLLDEIEQALYAEDPKFAASVRTARARSRVRRSAVLGAVGVVVGLALVLVGLVSQLIWASVVGFVLVVGACAFAVQAIRGRDRERTPDTPEAAATPDPKQTGGLRNRMEDRLRRRFDEN
ncbi:Protein of unknown function [Jatrophihabitans endophyticus]|uniref:DUF3040 domain-containing protein n=1 Tax=Jatrophihabitans endophyticus TaxID=1206085 RepID=A0A1M5L7T9_9ACTN|nr:DUF3040 domain-containing protein [Jatrophihabitans endophyticus]SHG61107.1 Protein of unknown function [Jatrophihabitans endophyticus]